MNFNESVKLKDWLNSGRSDEELQDIFFNMDLTMKYIHEKGYCIKSFNLNEIEILNNSTKQIKFNTLLKLRNDYTEDSELIHEDIYNSAFLQIGVYTKCLDYMKPVFLKENFDSFSTFLPEGDVPYYRGIIQRGANVYYSDFVLEKKKRDITKFENEYESAGEDLSRGRSLVKSNGHSISSIDSSGLINHNNMINDSIYKQLNNKKEAAFVGLMIFPTIMFVLGMVMGIIVWLSKMS